MTMVTAHRGHVLCSMGAPHWCSPADSCPVLFCAPGLTALFAPLSPYKPAFERSGHTSSGVLVEIPWLLRSVPALLRTLSRCRTLHRRRHRAGPGAAPAPARLCPRHLPPGIPVIAGALRLPAVRDAAATLPHPGILQCGTSALGTALRLIQAPEGALLVPIPAEGALTSVTAPPCNKSPGLWSFMTGAGPRHHSQCSGPWTRTR